MLKNTLMRWKLPLICFLWETAMIVLFGVFARYDIGADPHWSNYKTANNISDIENDFYFRYPTLYTASSLTLVPLWQLWSLSLQHRDVFTHYPIFDRLLCPNRFMCLIYLFRRLCYMIDRRH